VRPPEAGAVVEGADLARLDWWAPSSTASPSPCCRFDDAGLEELVTRRCVFNSCLLTGVRMGGVRNSGTAFLSCRFDRARLFDVIWDGCKLTPRRAAAADDHADSDWSWTLLRGADLSGLVLAGPAVPGGRPDRGRSAQVRRPPAGPPGEPASGGGSGVLLLRGASTGAVDWRAFEVTGPRLDLVQAVQVARAHGAPVGD
jgi:hypothetical protein